MENDPIRETLERLESANRLTPADVVMEAKSSRSPLHKYFTWDDAEAAVQYRLDQARSLIRSYEIVISRLPGRILKVQAFVHDVRKLNEQGYVAFDSLRSDADLGREYFLRELQAAKTHLEKLESVATALGYIQEVEVLRQQFATIISRISAQMQTPPQPMI